MKLAQLAQQISSERFILILFAAVLPGVCGCHTVQSSVIRHSKSDFSDEWVFNHAATNAPPMLGVALSGGGFRSACFCMGALRGLYDMHILTNVDVISAVSGGSYALSWLLSQPYYNYRDGRKVQDTLQRMFQRDGEFQTYVSTNSNHAFSFYEYPLLLPVTVPFDRFRQSFNKLYGADRDSFAREEYRRIVQETFQALPYPDASGYPKNLNTEATSGREFSRMKSVSVDEVGRFAQAHRLPAFIFNCSITSNTNRIWARTFEITPTTLGSDSCGYLSWGELKGYEFDAVRTFNLAPAISGAVICRENMTLGKYPEIKSAGVALAYADMGYEIPWRQQNRQAPVHLSDGGHCENLGLYALVRRRCQTIIVIDAEWEEHEPYRFTSYKALKMALSNEMHLDMVVPSIDNAAFDTCKPVMFGCICGQKGTDAEASPDLHIIYVKLSMDKNRPGDYPASVSAYAKGDSKFPQNPTLSMTYPRSKVVAYSDLAYQIITTSPEIGSLTNRIVAPVTGGTDKVSW